MGKKKSKKDEDIAYQMMSLEDVRQRELKYTQRIEALKACLNYLDDIMNEMERLNEENRLQENWEAYLRCDGLPKPYIPPDIRLFFVKLRHFEAEGIERNIDWTLSVDNRSVLTQNIFRIDKTRETVKKEKLPDFGGEYNKRVDLALQVLKGIEYYLVDDHMTARAKPRILDDITEQKKSVHNEIYGFLDRYSYRILCSEDAYMEDIDARTAEHAYAANNFQIHIWTVKNVPIIFEFLDDPFMIANLHCIKVAINIPFGILQDNLTIRAIHFEFDPFSEFAKSYEQKMTVNLEELNAGITDLRDCLVNEWKMQLQLQLDTRDLMIKKRLEYEEKKRQYEEEEAQRNKNKNKDKEDDKKKKKVKPIKLPKEPPIIGENEVPDTWRDFLKKENKEFDDFLNTIYHPDLLNLEWHEINMKKYFMLGGIYQFDFVGKARHFDFSSFNMTWHENDGKLLIKNDLRIRSSSFAQRQSDDVRKKSTGSEVVAESEFDNNISPWFVITMELPEFLCLWGEPLPCQFEADVTGYIEEEKVETTTQPSHNKSKKLQATQALQAAVADKMAASQDRSSVASFLRGSLHSLSITADRQGSIFRLANMLMASQRGSTTLDALQQSIEDFDLHFPLAKNQIRFLARHCLPRIISSYKFPSEFSAEAREKSAKAKSAGGTLVRQKHATATEEESAMIVRDPDREERTFTTLQQYDPERLFPLFQTPEELNILRYFNQQINDESAPRTFYQLIERLDGIKRYYQARPMRTAKLPYFVPNLKLLHPTIKQRRQQLLPEETGGRMRRSTRSMLSAHPSAASVSSRMHHRKTVHELPQPIPRANIAAVAAAAVDEDVDEEDEGEGEDVDDAEQIEEEEVVDTRKTFKFSRWTTQHIKHFEFDRTTRKLTIWTDRLGVFGLAYKRYEHFPFRYWTLEPSEENPENEVVFTLETQFVKVVLFVTGDGVRGYVTDLQKKFVRNRPMFLVIEQPLKDFRELRKRFREKNLNIFTERDASFYIENGYFSQKHLATELHTYCCMCTHALLMRFLYSEWNRLASRRDLIFRLVHHKESEEYMCTVRVKPEEATFVTIKELCSDDLNVFNLEYTLTWRNIDFYADVHHLITSMYPSAPEQRVKNPHLLYFLKALLWEIRPLSFS